jgi:hypothetical protein
MQHGAMHQSSATTCQLAGAHYHFNHRDHISEELHGGKEMLAPPTGFVASPEVSPGVTVGTLQTGYPNIQASSQDKGYDVHPRTATHPTAPDHATPLRWA